MFTLMNTNLSTTFRNFDDASRYVRSLHEADDEYLQRHDIVRRVNGVGGRYVCFWECLQYTYK